MGYRREHGALGDMLWGECVCPVWPGLLDVFRTVLVFLLQAAFVKWLFVFEGVVAGAYRSV